MKVRELPGAFALGLLASVLGHSAAYGNAHAMGGPYHGLLLTLVAAGVGLLTLAGAAIAWVSAGRIADGSILAARLSRFLPGTAALAGSTAAWYCFFEAIEGSHADAPFLVVLAALIAATLLVQHLARATVAAIAAIVISIARSSFAPRALVRRRLRERPLHICTDAALPRLFARPPPA